jgi:FimV-like protein
MNDEKLTRAQAFLDASDEASARELVDEVLAEEPKNARALRLDDAIARQTSSEERDRQNADDATLSVGLAGRGRAIFIGLMIVLLGVLLLAYMTGQFRARQQRPPATQAGK